MTDLRVKGNDDGMVHIKHCDMGIQADGSYLSVYSVSGRDVYVSCDTNVPRDRYARAREQLLGLSIDLDEAEFLEGDEWRMVR